MRLLRLLLLVLLPLLSMYPCCFHHLLLLLLPLQGLPSRLAMQGNSAWHATWSIALVTPKR